jgi:hypothetical protein
VIKPEKIQGPKAGAPSGRGRIGLVFDIVYCAAPDLTEAVRFLSSAWLLYHQYLFRRCFFVLVSVFCRTRGIIASLMSIGLHAPIRISSSVVGPLLRRPSPYVPRLHVYASKILSFLAPGWMSNPLGTPWRTGSQPLPVILAHMPPH